MPKKALIITLVILGLAAYGVGSFWVIGMINQRGIPSPFTPKQTTEANATNTTQANFPSATPQPTATPLPTPTPLQGPGVYACDGDGKCNNYNDEMRKSCPKTFADSHCLGMCGTPSVRCSN
jgi:hypothetical protein